MITKVLFRGIKALPFALLTVKQHHVLAALKSCDIAKQVPTNGKFFRNQIAKISKCVGE